jgi:hypothetical protein
VGDLVLGMTWSATNDEIFAIFVTFWACPLPTVSRNQPKLFWGITLAAEEQALPQ